MTQILLTLILIDFVSQSRLRSKLWNLLVQKNGTVLLSLVGDALLKACGSVLVKTERKFAAEPFERACSLARKGRDRDVLFSVSE